MDITLHTTATTWTLTLNGVAFDGSLDASEPVETLLGQVAEQLKQARWKLQERAFEAKMQRPDFYPHWTLAQGLAVMIRDGYLTDQGTIRVVGQWANTCSATFEFGWLLHLADTCTCDRFRQEIVGLGDKRLQILKDALVQFKAAHPDQLYTGRLSWTGK